MFSRVYTVVDVMQLTNFILKKMWYNPTMAIA